MGISLPTIAPESCSNPQKTRQVFTSGMKKNFGVFCEWHHKWSCFRPFCPTSPGPRPKPLDGSISLKFYWKLGEKSFDTLGDLLGFWVKKL